MSEHNGYMWACKNFSKRPEHDGHTFYGMSNAETECCQNTIHVNLGPVRVQQDLRNDTSMICISVQTGVCNVAALVRLLMEFVILIQKNAEMRMMNTKSMRTRICMANAV